jgi:hypothetical protein
MNCESAVQDLNLAPSAQDLVPGYRKTTEEYLDALMVLSARLNRLLALALGLAPDYFDDKFTTPLVSLRPLHYNESVSNPTEVRSAAPVVQCHGLRNTFTESYMLEIWVRWVSNERISHVQVNRLCCLETK